MIKSEDVTIFNKKFIDLSLKEDEVTTATIYEKELSGFLKFYCIHFEDPDDEGYQCNYSNDYMGMSVLYYPLTQENFASRFNDMFARDERFRRDFFDFVFKTAETYPV